MMAIMTATMTVTLFQLWCVGFGGICVGFIMGKLSR